MDSEVALPEYNKDAAQYLDLREKPSEAREPMIVRTKVERAREGKLPAPMEEWASTEADLRQTVETGGGVFVGLQERVGGKPFVVQFNDPEARTKSTISIDPEVEEVTPENVRRRIEEKRRTVPAEEKTYRLGI